MTPSPQCELPAVDAVQTHRSGGEWSSSRTRKAGWRVLSSRRCWACTAIACSFWPTGSPHPLRHPFATPTPPHPHPVRHEEPVCCRHGGGPPALPDPHPLGPLGVYGPHIATPASCISRGASHGAQRDPGRVLADRYYRSDERAHALFFPGNRHERGYSVGGVPLLLPPNPKNAWTALLHVEG